MASWCHQTQIEPKSNADQTAIKRGLGFGQTPIKLASNQNQTAINPESNGNPTDFICINYSVIVQQLHDQLVPTLIRWLPNAHGQLPLIAFGLDRLS